MLQTALLASSLRPPPRHRLPVAERVAALVDEGSFTELLAKVRSTAPWPGPMAPRPDGDGMVVGVGRVDGRAVTVVANDPELDRGSIGERGAEKACLVVERAAQIGMPVVFLVDSEGARVHEGMASVFATGRLLAAIARASGRVPLLCATLGLAGGAAGSAAALCDLNVGVRGQGFAYVTGPLVIKAVTGEDVSLDAIGGSDLHASRTGLLSAVVDDDGEAIAWLRRALTYLPSNAWSVVMHGGGGEEPVLWNDPPIPEDAHLGYDIMPVIERICDRASFFELSPGFARNLVTTFGRLQGRPVGIVANQPRNLAGVLDAAAAIKAARFVRLCNAFNVPLITLVDSPGFRPGVRSEQAGLLLDGAKLIAAYSEAHGQIPTVAVILRKSCGAASILGFGADVTLALPSAQVQPLGVEALLQLVHGGDLPDVAAALREQARRSLAAVIEAPLSAVHSGHAHRLVEPQALRAELAGALEIAPPARPAAAGGRKLCNLPL